MQEEKRTITVKQIDYTPFEILQIKGSFMYFIGLTTVTVVAISFMAISGVGFVDIMRPTLVDLIAIVIAFIIYHRKKNRKKPSFLPWIMAFLTVLVPILAKYNYGMREGWTFALQSYNSSILLITLIALLYLLYDKKLFIFYSIFAILNWSFFFYWASVHGGEVHLEAIVDGKPIVTGVIILREVFFIMMTAFIFYLLYRNIPVVEEFNSRTDAQRKLIEKQAEAQRAITLEIKERMSHLFERVDEQDRLVTRFNDKMQSQSAGFEEMSATMEELYGASENINTTAKDQVEGNVAMENIVNDFKSIKEETTTKLRDTYGDIEEIVAQTSISNESLREVESTIGKISEQSKIIGETVSIIVDIADKINLLSLNASIEAARAGDYGRGFAVVADEIGKLAVLTTESIKEIEKVLSFSTNTTAEGVAVITSTAETIKKLIGKMGESSGKIKLLQESILVEERYIKVIIEQMTKNIDMAKQIGTSTLEQKKAIGDTTKAIDQSNMIVAEMVQEIRELSNTSNSILKNATELLMKAKEVV
jgi:methyl-accepting chemotaxis protein